jgi:hypothetical protein
MEPKRRVPAGASEVFVVGQRWNGLSYVHMREALTGNMVKM